MSANVVPLTLAGVCCVLIGCSLLCQPISGHYLHVSRGADPRTKRLYEWLFKDEPSEEERQQRIETLRNINNLLFSRFQYSSTPYWIGRHPLNPISFTWRDGSYGRARRHHVINIRRR